VKNDTSFKSEPSSIGEVDGFRFSKSGLQFLGFRGTWFFEIFKEGACFIEVNAPEEESVGDALGQGFLEGRKGCSF